MGGGKKGGKVATRNGIGDQKPTLSVQDPEEKGTITTTTSETRLPVKTKKGGSSSQFLWVGGGGGGPMKRTGGGEEECSRKRKGQKAACEGKEQGGGEAKRKSVRLLPANVRFKSPIEGGESKCNAYETNKGGATLSTLAKKNPAPKGGENNLKKRKKSQKPNVRRRFRTFFEKKKAGIPEVVKGEGTTTVWGVFAWGDGVENSIPKIQDWKKRKRGGKKWCTKRMVPHTFFGSSKGKVDQPPPTRKFWKQSG